MMSIALDKKFPLLLAALVAISTPACSTAFMKKAQNTDTLFDLLTLMAGKSDDDALPIERIPSYPGEIITAHVRARPEGFLVSGTMRRISPYPPPRSHIDVTLFDANGRVLEKVAADYKPGIVPPGYRSGLPLSHYAIWLRTLHPPPGSKVRIVFDDRSKPAPVCSGWVMRRQGQ